MKTENINNNGSNFHKLHRDKKLPDKNDIYFDINVSDDNVQSSIADSPSTKIRYKWILQLMVVMYAMVFNGMVYGYTSPAFPSLVEQNPGNLNQIGKLLWILIKIFWTVVELLYNIYFFNFQSLEM